MEQRVLPVAGFPIDNKEHHIFWLGKLSFDKAMQSQHVIRAHLKTTGDKSGDYQPFVDVPLGYLPLLKIGSVWRNGHWINKKVGSYKTFKDVQFDNGNSNIINAGAHMGYNDYAIPPFKYNLGVKTGLLDSCCYAIKRNNDPYAIIIPCWEIIRFYYAQSSALVGEIFYPWLDLYRLRNPDHTWRASGNTFRIRLRRSFTDLEAPFIARIVFSDYAFSCAERIMSSVMEKSSNFEIPFPEARPPFEGKATIRARGIRLVKKRFLVLEIINCSGPFPFKKLAFDRDNQTENNNFKRELVKRGYPRSISLGGSAHVPGEKKVQPGEPDKDEPLRILGVKQNGFDYLKKIEIKKIPREPGDKKTLPKWLTDIMKDHSGYSTAKGSYSGDDLDRLSVAPKESDVKPPDVKESDFAKVPVTLAAFQRIVAILSDKFGVNYNYRKIFNSYPNTCVSLFPRTRGVGRVLKWSLNSIKKRARQCLIAEIKYLGGYHYLFESEHLPGENHAIAIITNTNKSKMNDRILETILESCVRNKGVWAKDGENEGLRKTRFYHSRKKSYDRHAELIYIHLQSDGDA